MTIKLDCLVVQLHECVNRTKFWEEVFVKPIHDFKFSNLYQVSVPPFYTEEQVNLLVEIDVKIVETVKLEQIGPRT